MFKSLFSHLNSLKDLISFKYFFKSSYNVWKIKSCLSRLKYIVNYNPPINFQVILLATLSHVV